MFKVSDKAKRACARRVRAAQAENRADLIRRLEEKAATDPHNLPADSMWQEMADRLKSCLARAAAALAADEDRRQAITELMETAQRIATLAHGRYKQGAPHLAVRRFEEFDVVLARCRELGLPTSGKSWGTKPWAGQGTNCSRLVRVHPASMVIGTELPRLTIGSKQLVRSVHPGLVNGTFRGATRTANPKAGALLTTFLMSFTLHGSCW